MKDYERVISLWLECKLINSKGSATRRQLLQKIRRDRDLFLVCEDEEKEIIGTVMGSWDGWRAWIYKVAVAENFRNEGIATKLLDAVVRQLRKRFGRNVIIRAYIERGNEASLSLFRKLGFETINEFVIVTLGRQ